MRANMIGLTIAIGVSIIASSLLPLTLNSNQTLGQTLIEYDSVAVAIIYAEHAYAL